MGKKTSLYLNEQLSRMLEKYAPRVNGELSSTLTILTDRYDVLMAAERRTIRDLFTDGEHLLMLDNALSTMYEPAAIIQGSVLADAEDQEDAEFDRFGVDRAALIGKLRELTPGQQFALVDWLEELRGKRG